MGEVFAQDARKFKILNCIGYFMEQGYEETGWNMFQHTVEETSETIEDYGTFKKVLAALEAEGLVVKTGAWVFPEGKKRAKHWGSAVWKATPALQAFMVAEWAERNAMFDRRDEGSTEWEDWLDTWVTKDNPVPRGTWKTLMDRVKAGELRLRFSGTDDDE